MLFLLVRFTGAVATASLDLDLSIELALSVERANDLIWIHDRNTSIGFNVGSGNGTGLVDADLQGQGLAAVRDHEDLLQIQNDVGDIFDDTVDALKFVADTFDFNRGYGSTFNRAKEDTTEGITDRMTITGLERFGDELSVGICGTFLDFCELIGELELSETFWHGDETLVEL